MIITLDNMIFFAHHGVFESERLNGNTFRVSVHIELDDTPGCTTDRVEDTLNYQQVYDIVREEMSHPSNLLEHVANRIIKRLSALDELSRISVCVEKQNPPLGGDVQWVGVTLQHRRHNC